MCREIQNISINLIGIVEALVGRPAFVSFDTRKKLEGSFTSFTEVMNFTRNTRAKNLSLNTTPKL